MENSTICLRGKNHLVRLGGLRKKLRIIGVRNGVANDCVTYVMGPKKILLFNSFFGEYNERNLPFAIPMPENELSELFKRYFSLSIVNDLMFFDSVFVLGENFDSEYEEFVSSNKKLTNQVFGKYCEKYNPMSLFAYALVGNSPNMFVWVLTNYFKYRVNLYTIMHIIQFSKNYPKCISKLSKGTITAYNNKKPIQSLVDEIVSVRKDKRCADAINMFNTCQRKMLREVEQTSDFVNIVSRFYRLSTPKKINFVKKMSDCENVNELLRQMSLVSNSHYKWNKESFLDYVNNAENIDCDIVADKGSVVVVKTNNYDTIKYLAKSTNWCISKNKKYWNDYLWDSKNNKQYVLFDFSKAEDDDYSIVGFTVRDNREISHAHNFSNKSIISDEIDRSMLKCFMNDDRGSIYSVLRKNGMSICDFVNSENSRYEWNYESFMKCFHYYLGDDDYTIYLDDGERFVFSSSSTNVKYLVGDNLIEQDSICGNLLFFFVDFRKSGKDPNRILFSIITKNRNTGQEEGSVCLNVLCSPSYIVFNKIISDYGLPYDIISRVNDNTSVFKTALLTFDSDIVKFHLSNGDFVKKIKNKFSEKDKQAIYTVLYTSVVSFKSNEYILLPYQMGISWSDIIGSNLLSDLLFSIIREINRHPSCLIEEFDNYESVIDGELSFNNRDRHYIMNLMAIINEIMKKETDSSSINILLNKAYSVSLNPKVMYELTNIIIKSGAINNVLPFSPFFKFIGDDKMLSQKVFDSSIDKKLLEDVSIALRGYHSYLSVNDDVETSSFSF